MWTLKKSKREATCTLSTHPLGWELKVQVSDELMRSEVRKSEPAVFDTSDAWKSQWAAKGWSECLP